MTEAELVAIEEGLQMVTKGPIYAAVLDDIPKLVAGIRELKKELKISRRETEIYASAVEFLQELIKKGKEAIGG